MRLGLRSAPLIALLLVTSARAQPAPQELFVVRSAVSTSAAMDAAGSSSPAIVGQVSVGIRIDRLFPAANEAAPRLQLNIPGRRWIARFERIDSDPSGFRSWVGGIEGIDYSHVVFTERDGIVSGLVNAVWATYQVRTLQPGAYVLEQIDPLRLKGESEPLIWSTVVPHAAAASSITVTPAAAVIDVLVLYTPHARARAGGTPNIQALASQTISDSNTIYARSGITARLRLAGATELALNEAPSMQGDLDALTSSALARSLRDAAGADLVQLLVSSPDPDTCGVSWLLTSLDDTEFPAYSVADIICIAQYTPTHEMAHNMGSHHAPEDGASHALFEYSYAFKDPQNRFRTVMAYQCPDRCPRIPNFSNPALVVTGPAVDLRAEVNASTVTLSWRSSGEGVTGAVLQNNALSINNAAATVANFRGRSAPSASTGATAPLLSETSYVLQVGSASGVANIFDGSVGTATTVSGALGAGVYFWRVFSVNSGGVSLSSESAFSVPATCAGPGPPQNFTFSVSGRGVTLNWTAPASGNPPTGYQVEAGSAMGLANLYRASLGVARSLAVGQVPPGIYFVRIRAENACGTSAPSNEQVISVP